MARSSLAATAFPRCSGPPSPPPTSRQRHSWPVPLSARSPDARRPSAPRRLPAWPPLLLRGVLTALLLPDGPARPSVGRCRALPGTTTGSEALGPGEPRYVGGPVGAVMGTTRGGRL